MEESSTKIALKCHICQQSLRANPRLAGQTIPCPRCSEPLIVPDKRSPEPPAVTRSTAADDASTNDNYTRDRVNWFGVASCIAVACLMVFPLLGEAEFKLATCWPGWVLLAFLGAEITCLLLRKTDISRGNGLITGLLMIGVLVMVLITSASLKTFNRALAVGVSQPTKIKVKFDSLDSDKHGKMTWNLADGSTVQAEVSLSEGVSAAGANFSVARLRFPAEELRRLWNSKSNVVSVGPPPADKNQPRAWELKLKLNRDSLAGRSEIENISGTLPWGGVESDRDGTVVFSSWIWQFPIQIGGDMEKRYRWSWTLIALILSVVALLYSSTEPAFYGRGWWQPVAD